jgi:hypothetical protein
MIAAHVRRDATNLGSNRVGNSRFAMTVGEKQ